MTPRFIAAPPERVKFKLLWEHIRLQLQKFLVILVQCFVPFRPQPEAIDDIPETDAKVNSEQVAQCQKILDEADGRREHLEQKAQSTFGLIAFLAPLVISAFAYLAGSAENAIAENRGWLVGASVISAVFMLLAFVSVARAVSVKAAERLFVMSVIDDNGRFREYNEAFHARGLLYCAAMNEAMNDHIAQFVKGAHVLTVAAILALLIGAAPIGLRALNSPSTMEQSELSGLKDVTAIGLAEVRDELSRLRHDLQERQLTDEWVKRLEQLEEATKTLEVQRDDDQGSRLDEPERRDKAKSPSDTTRH